MREPLLSLESSTSPSRKSLILADLATTRHQRRKSHMQQPNTVQQAFSTSILNTEFQAYDGVDLVILYACRMCCIRGIIYPNCINDVGGVSSHLCTSSRARKTKLHSCLAHPYPWVNSSHIRSSASYLGHAADTQPPSLGPALSSTNSQM